MKKLLSAGLVIFSSLLVTLWWQWPDQNVHYITCDVGQGDAFLVTEGFTQVLIDGGKDQQVLGCLHNHVPWWDRQIELIVGTHADADHIGGLTEVLATYDVRKILFSDTKNTADFEAFNQALLREETSGAVVLSPDLGQKIRIGKLAEFEIISSRGATETQLLDASGEEVEGGLKGNDGSIVLLLRMGRVTVLLTGDIEEAGEIALRNQAMISDVDILKVAHHGSKTSSHDWFLQLAQPEIAVISNGKNNPYGHPHSQVIDRLQTMGVQILRTDQLGEIEIFSNGEKYWTEREIQIHLGEKREKNETVLR